MLVLTRKAGEGIDVSLNGQKLLAVAISSAAKRLSVNEFDVSMSDLVPSDFAVSMFIKTNETKRNDCKLGFVDPSGIFQISRT